MAEALQTEDIQHAGHSRLVRICHWLVAACFLLLAFTGIVILMVHPRLYWGEVGNDLVPAILEIPISTNHQPEGWERTTTFAPMSEGAEATFSANRTYPIFNENSWGRSLHFLAGWIFVVAWLTYGIAGLISGHLRKDLLPAAGELRPTTLWQDLLDHLKLRSGGGGGPPYNVLQKLAYVGAFFVALPLMVVTGLTMSPAVTAAWPILLDIFGGYQSARTVHFFAFAALVLFFVVHIFMVVVSGFRKQLRAMILGR